jgi:copper chaperone
MEVLVFKTNIRYKKQVQTIVTQLNGLEGILRCNVDLYDKDKILRIEASDLSPRVIEHTLLEAGYFCEELID